KRERPVHSTDIRRFGDVIEYEGCADFCVSQEDHEVICSPRDRRLAVRPVQYDECEHVLQENARDDRPPFYPGWMLAAENSQEYQQDETASGVHAGEQTPCCYDEPSEKEHHRAEPHHSGDPWTLIKELLDVRPPSAGDLRVDEDADDVDPEERETDEERDCHVEVDDGRGDEPGVQPSHEQHGPDDAAPLGRPFGGHHPPRGRRGQTHTGS
ncbi:hypothetical protein PMAYCL1PPCAC_21195, partial [Pristionchus mayeri]